MKIFKIILVFVFGAMIFGISYAQDDFHTDYEARMSALGELGADKLEGDFYRLIVWPWGGSPTAITFYESEGDGVLRLVRLEYDERQKRLRPLYHLERIYFDLPVSYRINREFIENDFFERQERDESVECYHPTHYWLEARVSNKYNLIRRDCDRMFQNGYAAAKGLVAEARAEFGDAPLEMACMFCPGFPVPPPAPASKKTDE